MYDEVYLHKIFHMSEEHFIVINFVIGSTGENRTNHVHYNIRMQQLPCPVLIICPDSRHFLEKAQKLAEFSKTSMLRCINRRNGHLHLCRPH